VEGDVPLDKTNRRNLLKHTVTSLDLDGLFCKVDVFGKLNLITNKVTISFWVISTGTNELTISGCSTSTCTDPAHYDTNLPDPIKNSYVNGSLGVEILEFRQNVIDPVLYIDVRLNGGVNFFFIY
jgi:hypothetical protein